MRKIFQHFSISVIRKKDYLAGFCSFLKVIGTHLGQRECRRSILKSVKFSYF